MRFRFLTWVLLAILVLLIAVTVLLYVRPPSATGVERWGVTFSHTQLKLYDLDWKAAYREMLEELEPEIVRIPVYWNVIEREEGSFYFDEYDFLIQEARDYDVELVLAVGTRVPRWPECHVPKWAQSLDQEKQGTEVKDAIIATVDRYAHEKHISMWQVENEPFLPFFGECPPPDPSKLREEVDLVRFLDDTRPILVTDSGEIAPWVFAAGYGDVFGTTMYKTVWSNTFSPYLGYITYPFPPQFFWLKANLVHLLHGFDKRIINVELQAEPWGPDAVYTAKATNPDVSPSMSLPKFYENVEYARQVGFPDVYLWGVEWWYLLKEKHGDDRFWEAAKDVIQTET